MEVNIGIDLGTTYTTITFKNDERIEKYTLINDHTSLIHSATAYNTLTKRYSFGAKAVTDTYSRNTTSFRYFKMLLSETDEKLLQTYGYDKANSPAEITLMFITFLIQSFLRDKNFECIDHLYIGAPEIWFDDNRTIDTRSKLKQLFEKIEYKNNPAIKDVQIISEPSAACAYFVYNHEKKYQQKFKGHCLVVDYGGGTLDIVLCKVEQDNDNTTVQDLTHSGRGESIDQHVGEAGAAFFEELASIALKNQIGEFEKDTEFLRFLDDLEKEILNVDIAEGFGMVISDYLNGRLERFDLLMNQLDDFKKYENDNLNQPLTVIVYQDKAVNIYCWMAVEAYRKINYLPLKEELEKMKIYMEQKRIDYSLSNYKHFQVLMVGGFSKFDLTKQQVHNFFGYKPGDNRFPRIEQPDAAIAYGLGYYANKLVTYKYTVPYDLGIANKNGKFFWACKRGWEMEPGQPMYIKQENSAGKMVNAMFGGDGIKSLVFNNTAYGDKNQIGLPPEELKELLHWDDRSGIVFNIGFSFDRSYVFSLHRKEYKYLGLDENGRKRHEELGEIVVELTNLNDWFGGLRIIAE